LKSFQRNAGQHLTFFKICKRFVNNYVVVKTLQQQNGARAYNLIGGDIFDDLRIVAMFAAG
jgi:hypothetical protein